MQPVILQFRLCVTSSVSWSWCTRLSKAVLLDTAFRGCTATVQPRDAALHLKSLSDTRWNWRASPLRRLSTERVLHAVVATTDRAWLCASCCSTVSLSSQFQISADSAAADASDGVFCSRLQWTLCKHSSGYQHWPESYSDREAMTLSTGKTSWSDHWTSTPISQLKDRDSDRKKTEN